MESAATGMTRSASKRGAGSVSDSDSKRARLDAGSDIANVDVCEGGNGDVLKTPVDSASVSTSASVAPADASQADPRKGGKKEKPKKEPKQWTGRRRGTRLDRPEGSLDAAGSGTGAEASEKTPRLPKRQCALLIGFCGSGYNGMQIQPEVRTIEGMLFKALIAAGAVSQDNADDPVKVGLQRAARTDAGVHAAGNVVSLKIITAVPGVPDLVARINEELPPEIRLWSFRRVQNSFNARMSCDSRKYTYFFPAYLLIPPKPSSGLYRTFLQQSTSSDSASAPDEPRHPFWEDANLEAKREDEIARKKRWRVGTPQIEALRTAAKRFEGTHNFHNFTVGRDPKDRSCMRHMKKIEVADPVVYGETEWISVMLHGQSFMLHQRKMMCVLVMAVRTGTPSTIIDALYGPRTVAVPKMPSLGLLLEHPIFESYNKRVEGANTQAKLAPSDVEYRPPLEFDTHVDAMLKFKEEHIYNKMREAEDKVEVFDRWLYTFDRYSGSDLLYYNAQGTIPDAAVVYKGVRRANQFRERKRFDATEFKTDVLEKTFADDEEDDDEDDEAEVEKISKRDLEETEG
ncbi:hypothetical protein M0805_006680 [Coniferiporia weirii]|nr:hypothetical protein M0805_006680 [Coniferiporia weirii]